MSKEIPEIPRNMDSGIPNLGNSLEQVPTEPSEYNNQDREFSPHAEIDTALPDEKARSSAQSNSTWWYEFSDLDSFATTVKSSFQEEASSRKTAPHWRTGFGVSLMKLTNRRIDVGKSADRSKDEEWQELCQTLSRYELSKDQIARVIRRVQAIAKQADENDALGFDQWVDSLRSILDETAENRESSMVLSEYFNSMVEKSQVDNEAVLQRTAMMNVFHSYWLSELLDWNAEGQWRQPDHTRIPSQNVGDKEDELSLPKPDFAMSFRWQPFKREIDYHMAFPPGSMYEQVTQPEGDARCFPFLFAETGRSKDSLDEANLKNLHTASQALYNMSLWMDKADRMPTFFDKIRVFTFVINAKEFSFRIHRASPRDGELEFLFDELIPSATLSRDRIRMLVNKVIHNYVLKILRPELLKAVRIFCGYEERSASDQHESRVESDGPDPAPHGEREAHGTNALKRAQGNDGDTDTSRNKRSRKESKEDQHTGCSQSLEQMSVMSG